MDIYFSDLNFNSVENVPDYEARLSHNNTMIRYVTDLILFTLFFQVNL